MPAQADAEIAGLNATKDQAFGDILGGARERGVGFWGVPLAEQAKYTSQQFLPAVARVRQSQNDLKGTLANSLADINLDQRKTALGLQQQEADREFQAAEAEKERRAKAAENTSLYSALYGGKQAAPVAAKPTVSENDSAAAYLDVQGRLGRDNDQALLSDFKATLASANKGNAKDKLKVELYQKYRPDLFVNAPAQSQYKYGVLSTPAGRDEFLRSQGYKK